MSGTCQGTINIIIPCVPGQWWQCQLPLNGYKYDNCGNVVADSTCNPALPIIGVDPNGETPPGTTVCTRNPNNPSDINTGVIDNSLGYHFISRNGSYIVRFSWGLSEVPQSWITIGMC